MAQLQTPPRPNVVLILADDMGYSDIGCFGSEIPTPALDSLASRGLRMTAMYNCARCCPSRASLLTGLYPHQAGVGQMTKNLGTPAFLGYLIDRCATLGVLLGAAGYFTGYSGKWHVGGQRGRSLDPSAPIVGDPRYPSPIERGFERVYCNLAGGGSYYNLTTLMEQDRLIPCPGGFYTTNNYTDAAIGMIDAAAAASRPFFVHLCYNAPHWPLHALPEDVARHRGRYRRGWDEVRTARHERLRGLGILDRRWGISPRDAESRPWESAPHQDWEDSRMAAYAGQIDCMDRNIGRVVQRLRELGQLDNTLILFVSDNGGSAEFLAEDGTRKRELPFTLEGKPVRCGNTVGIEPGPADTFMSYDLPWANASNSPFRLFKHWVHEGGIATPFVAHWPAGVAAGQVRHEPAHFVDIVATILDAAGVSYPSEFGGRALTPPAGESFRALFGGAAWSRRQPIFWEHMGNRAVRRGDLKLVARHGGGWELYNMSRDRTELDDLSARYPADVTEMERLYGELAARCGVVPWDDVVARQRR